MFSFLKKIHFTKCHSKQCKESHPNTVFSERGSVMLEVIAVLALMGVMGAMLYRQIYQRNQELHNIQMASEIRTVKEAFSAYIQAERSILIAECPEPPAPANPNDPPQVLPCPKTGNYADYSDLTLAPRIKTYLPDGWFGGGITLGEAYSFSLWVYRQGDATEKTVLYGVVVPKNTTLPQTGWNFKRAARVALLIGADGGVFDEKNGITNNDLAGSLGTWAFPMDGRMCGTDNSNTDDCPHNTYAAMTGMDIFTPEYEPPEGDVNLRRDWSLALHDLHAWGYFSVGNTTTGGNCYTIGHDNSSMDNGKMRVDSDRVDPNTPGSCTPLFFVNGQDGTVFVNSDLKVGKDGTEAITITQEGLVKQQTGLVIDKDGRIVSRKIVDTDKGTNAGEFRNDERYVVDPAYTSNMNDIRLASRGGARLSDILPNYILKDKDVSDCNIAPNNKTCSFTITNAFNCPTGYTKAFFVALLQSAADASIEANAHSHTINGNTGAAPNKYVTGHDGSGNPEIETDAHTHTINVNTTAASNKYATQIQNPTITVSNDNDTTWTVNAALANNSSSARNMKFSWQTYCVFDATAAGATFTGKLPAKDNENQCKAAGFTWDTAKGCRYVYIGCTLIDTTAAITDKAAVCKAAGCKWTPGVGGAAGTCAN